MKKLAILIMLLASPLLAQQDPVLALRDASLRIEAATTALANANKAGDQVVAITGAIRSLEEGLASLRIALLASKSREAEKQAEMLGNRAELGRLLATLAALQNTPTALTLLHPDGATASVRAGAILAAITPALRAEAARLRTELTAISALNALHDKAVTTVQTALETLQAARLALTIALREATPELPAPQTATVNSEELARASQDLNALANVLGSRMPARARSVESPRGRLPLPITGTITRRFNQPNGAGIRQPGMVITAPALSLVLAPQAGIVRFAGDFMEYGRVVILEPNPDQLQIYAGFGQVYVKVGEVLESGAAMGLLGGEMPDSAEFLAESGSETDKAAESLYIEIRENGIPVDPQTWFAIN